MAQTLVNEKFWGPVDQVVDWLADKYRDQRVLEIGPGSKRFPSATDFVDWCEIKDIPAEHFWKIDLNEDPLPFENKSFDLVYCRHVVEDMAYPFPLIKEMSRVAKAGYIETPSPLCEMTRGVDGNAPLWRGYCHHRWVIWPRDGAINFIPKYSCIESMEFDDELEKHLEQAKYWNTYFLWDDAIEVKRWRHDHEFSIGRNYGALLKKAVRSGIDATDEFWTEIAAECGRCVTGAPVTAEAAE